MVRCKKHGKTIVDGKNCADCKPEKPKIKKEA